MLDHVFRPDVIAAEIDLVEIVVPADPRRAFLDLFDLITIGRLPHRHILVSAVLMRVVFGDDAAQQFQIVADQRAEQSFALAGEPLQVPDDARERVVQKAVAVAGEVVGPPRRDDRGRPGGDAAALGLGAQSAAPASESM